MATNYFVCTLGQALLGRHGQREGRRIEDVTSLIDHQADHNGAWPAAAFAYPSSQTATKRSRGHEVKVYTFADIQKGSCYVTALFARRLRKPGVARNSTIALLCPSTPEFLFAWLGLIRLGYAVLLLAPQCQPEAIAHLLTTCDVEVLLHDDLYGTLASRAAASAAQSTTATIECLPLGFSTDDVATALILQEELVPVRSTGTSDSVSIAYLHHTSGTSSGLPKPIAQSHRAAVCVLPHFDSGSQSATFTTTPLYHGGVADLFRAWTSSALIWLFPGKSQGTDGSPVQITANNVLSCLNIAQSQEYLPHVKYFSSVPYVLQSLASLPEGLEVLKTMDCVGVGGAALPTEVGDDLVNLGVNLLSRFGSAECGFLASSYRDFDVDKEWQYLRTTNQEDLLRFEARGDEKYELIVLPQWPHRVCCPLSVLELYHLLLT